MRGILCALLTVLVTVSILGTVRADKPDAAAQVKWARGVADDFWRAVLSGQTENAAGLLTPELANSLITHESVGRVGQSRLVEYPAHKWLAAHLPDGAKVTVTFEGSELSPDGGEAVFRGQLGGTDGRSRTVASDFTLRVAKEPATGRWSIRYVLVTERKNGEVKKP